MGERNTLETDVGSVIIVVGGPDVLIDAVTKAAHGLPAARVEKATLRDAATKIAALWPFAIVMSEDIYGFDPGEFDALSRDVAARLYTVPTDGVSAVELSEALGPALREALKARWDEG